VLGGWDDQLVKSIFLKNGDDHLGVLTIIKYMADTLAYHFVPLGVIYVYQTNIEGMQISREGSNR
jgi:hypothetical protein